MKQVAFSFFHLPAGLSTNNGQKIGRINLRILLLPLFLLCIATQMQAVTYKVISWRGSIKVKNQSIYQGQTFGLASDVKFTKTSDYIIVSKSGSTNKWSVTPSSFTNNLTKESACSGTKCKPVIKIGPPATGHYVVEVVSVQGSILVNGNYVSTTERFYNDDNIVFDKNSDFLVVKNEDGSILLIRPKNFSVNKNTAHQCLGTDCKAVTETASQVKKTKPAFYKTYIKPHVKVP